MQGPAFHWGVETSLCKALSAALPTFAVNNRGRLRHLWQCRS